MADITALLHRWRDGSRDSENELFAVVLPDLRRLARYLMKGERKGHTMQPTDLEEHTSELQSRSDLVCRLLLEKKKNHLEALGIVLSCEKLALTAALLQ